MDQQAAAVDVPQEVVAQARALAGPLDDAGDIGHDEGHALVHIHHAQVGVQGGEVVVGDFGVDLGHHAQQGALSHVGEAHQSHVRQQLQLQHHVVALAGQARLGKAGHLTGGGGEMLVAPAAPAALAQHKGLVVGHILDDLAGFGVPDQGAPGHADGQTLAVLAAFAAALAVYTVGRHIFALIAEVHQRGHIVVHPDDDAAAVAAVAAVGAACGDVFFPVKGDGSVAAVSGPDGDAGLINKSICHIVTSSERIRFYLTHFTGKTPSRQDASASLTTTLFFRESAKKACKTGSDVISYHGVNRAVLCRRGPERVGRRIHDGTNAYINRRKYPWI